MALLSEWTVYTHKQPDMAHTHKRKRKHKHQHTHTHKRRQSHFCSPWYMQENASVKNRPRRCGGQIPAPIAIDPGNLSSPGALCVCASECVCTWVRVCMHVRTCMKACVHGLCVCLCVISSYASTHVYISAGTHTQNVGTHTHTECHSLTPPICAKSANFCYVLPMCCYVTLSHTSPLCQECELFFRQLETTPAHPHRSDPNYSSNSPKGIQHRSFFRTYVEMEQLQPTARLTPTCKYPSMEQAHLHSMIKAVGGQNPFLDKCKMHMHKKDKFLSTW